MITNKEVLAVLDELRNEMGEHGMSEHAEMLWQRALMMRRAMKLEGTTQPEEDLPAMLRPQAM